MNYTAAMLTLPAMSAEFGTPLSAQAWLLNGTPLGLAAALLVAGSLADDHGRRRAFLIGTFALGATTALGALAGSTLTFTLARIAQGIASAAVIAASLGLIATAFPAGFARVRATGIWGASISGGIALGPVVAAGFAELDWRAGYWFLAALTLLGGALAARALPESRSPRGGRPDLLGTLALGLALTALTGALTLGRDGWLRTPVALLAAAAAAGLALFAYAERRAPRRGRAPVIDLALLRRPDFLASAAGALFTGLAVIGTFSYLSPLLQQTLQMSAIATAWLFLLWAGTSFAVALQVRRFAHRLTARHQLALGFAGHAAGILALLGALDGGSWPRLLPGLLIAGAGSGLLNAALPRIAVDSVPAERAAMGSGANNTARYIGSAAGVALTIAVATSAPGGLARGADLAFAVSAGLALVGAAVVLVLKPKH
ncbi:MFS transporter [Streptomyces sp. A7024]|uniref:MFS transporter n=2 Tax=Streptomyces coryli TaxID=1128680 RepID=A0A6G4UEM6_9ACTN|nr:MFS transporter [Streptomyces coryli]NGN70038.1 MFS transporter [Streptomyces coryli]